MDLTGEQAAMRKSVREIAEAEIRPVAAEADRQNTFPEDVWDTLAEVDLTALTVPETYGGLDVDRRTYALVNEEVAYGTLAVATALSVHSLATSCIATFGDEGLKESWLPGMAGGRPVGAFALSEAGAGSNPAEMETTARSDGDEYVINGEKQWITNGERSDVVICFARVPQTEAGSESPEAADGARDGDPGGITQFLVPKDADGLSAGEPMDKLGLRASDTTSLSFDGVRIPERNRLTPVGRGLAAALSILNGGRVGIAAQAVGLSAAALDEATSYATEREQFDQPIADFQAIRHTLAEMQTTVSAARHLTWEAARRMDAGEDARMAASMAKYFATEGAMDVTNDAVQIHGGVGYTTASPVERFYRDAKVTTIYEGTTQIQKSIIGRELLD